MPAVSGRIGGSDPHGQSLLGRICGQNTATFSSSSSSRCLSCSTWIPERKLAQSSVELSQAASETSGPAPSRHAVARQAEEEREKVTLTPGERKGERKKERKRF